MKEKYYNDYELVYLIREDSEEAMELMMRKYDPLIKSVVSYYFKKFDNFKVDFDDMVQEARLSLFMSLKKYDCDSGIAFYSFFLVCLKRKIYNYIRDISTKKMSYSLYDDNSENGFDIKEKYYYGPSYICENDFILENIIKFKNSLNNFDSCIFELRYNSFSYKDISSLLDIKMKKIDNTMIKIRKELRNWLKKS
jgi:RNA polymerase sporulation-specific sigma factor